MDTCDLNVSVSSHLTFLVGAKIIGNVLFAKSALLSFVGCFVSNHAHVFYRATLSISNTLYFDVAPSTSFTRYCGTPKYFANSFAAATFARPSMAGALV